MKRLSGQAAQAELDAWWRRQRRGHKVTKVLAANDYPGLFADVPSCQAWYDGRVDDSIKELFRDSYHSRIQRDYGSLVAERIREGVQVTRIVLMDMEALAAGRPGWRDWLAEQFYPRLIIPMTSESVYFLPTTMVHVAVRQLAIDINIFEGAGLMCTAYSEAGVAYRDFHDHEDAADKAHIINNTMLVSAIQNLCREEFRIQAIR